MSIEGTIKEIHNIVATSILLGAEQERKRIIKLLEEADSACSGWAVAIIEGDN